MYWFYEQCLESLDTFFIEIQESISVSGYGRLSGVFIDGGVPPEE
jgi:hypothetical protein